MVHPKDGYILCPVIQGPAQCQEPPLPALRVDFPSSQAAFGAGPQPGTPLPVPLPRPGPAHRPRPGEAGPARSSPAGPPRPAALRSSRPRPSLFLRRQCGIPGPAGPAANRPPSTARAAAISAVLALCPQASAVRREPLSGPSSCSAAMPAARAGPRRAALRPQHRGGPCAMSRPPLGTFSAPLASSSHGATLLLRPLSLPASSPPFPALHAGAGAARHSGSSPAADMATLTAVQPLTLDRGKRGCRRSPAAPPRPPCSGATAASAGFAPAAPARRALPRQRSDPAVPGTGCSSGQQGRASPRGSGGRREEV